MPVQGNPNIFKQDREWTERQIDRESDKQNVYKYFSIMLDFLLKN